MLQRTMYLIYYFTQMKWDLLKKFLNYASQSSGKSKARLLLESVGDLYKYNTSILEYFQFKFYEKLPEEKRKWAGTGYMYEYQLKMNPPKYRDILDDKTKFYKAYQPFFVHVVSDLHGLQTQPELILKLLSNPSGKLVFKVADGKCGAQVLIKSVGEFNESSLIGFMKQGGYDLVEEFIMQHPALNALSPSAVNTVRIFTQLNSKGKVEVLGCRQRISVNSQVDNMAAGNLAAPIEEGSGIIAGPGVYSDITKSDESSHPVTGIPITGFQVPYWKEILSIVKAASLAHPQNRSIGWDVAITEKGPGLIEGNHDWCKLLWQLPVQQGLRPMLEKHSAEFGPSSIPTHQTIQTN